MSTMTQVAEGLRNNAADLDRMDMLPMLAGYLRNAADAIDAHLAQPAQAVDVLGIYPVGYFIETRAGEYGRVSRQHEGDDDVFQLYRALSGEKAGPVGKYRLLGPNDVIEPDDEFIDDNAVDWVRAGSASGGHLFIGMQYRLGVLKQARRPLPASPAPDKEG